MPLPIEAVQQALRDEGLDGWLLYDFHGSNRIATRVAGLDRGGKMATRRWYYLIPASGEPRGLVHAIERHNLDELPGTKQPYSGRQQLDAGLRHLLQGVKRVAMEYSPGNNIPYLSRVDAGTVEAIREIGAEVVSSGDLVQRFEAVWTDAVYQTHVAASERLYQMKDRTFELIREQGARGRAADRVRGAAADDRLVRRARAEEGRAERLGAGERRQSALHAAGTGQPGHSSQ